MINSLAESLTKTVKGEIDIIQGEQEIAAASCVRARKKLGIPVIASLHNIWPEEIVAMNLIKETSKQYNFLQKLEEKIVSGSDLTIVVSKEMDAYVRKNYSLNECRILIVPPGGRPRITNLINQTPPFKVVYSGLVVQRAYVDLFVKSMPYVLKKYPKTPFYITAKGEHLQRIRKLAQKIGVQPEYYWFKTYSEYYKFLSSCHLGIVTSSNDIPRQIGPAVKLFDFLSVGLPVVANDIGGWTKLIETEKIGVLTSSDPECFAQGIMKLLADNELSQRLGERGLELVKEKMNWDSSAKLLLQKYTDLLEC